MIVDTKSVGIVDRAARILSCFNRTEPELTLPQISKRLRLPKATAFRILTNLVRHGLLEHNQPNNLYTLGFGTIRLANELLHSLTVRAAARPVMHAIRDAVNETVILSVREGDHRVNVDSVESTHAIGQTQQIGTAIPLYAGAASRAMLAALPDDEVDAYLDRIELVAYSKKTMTDPTHVRDDLDRIRRRGYATSDGDFTPGGHAVACVIFGVNSRVLGALHVSIPNARFSKQLEKSCVQQLADGVRAVAASIARGE